MSTTTTGTTLGIGSLVQQQPSGDSVISNNQFRLSRYAPLCGSRHSFDTGCPWHQGMAVAEAAVLLHSSVPLASSDLTQNTLVMLGSSTHSHCNGSDNTESSHHKCTRIIPRCTTITSYPILSLLTPSDLPNYTSPLLDHFGVLLQPMLLATSLKNKQHHFLGPPNQPTARHIKPILFASPYTKHNYCIRRLIFRHGPLIR